VSIILALFLFSGIESNADLKEYTYDLDGGICTHDVSASFNPQTIEINGGGIYMGNGGNVRFSVTLGNGLIIYGVSQFGSNPNYVYYYTLNPETGDIGAFQTNNPEELKEEGAVDTMQLKPCR